MRRIQSSTALGAMPTHLSWPTLKWIGFHMLLIKAGSTQKYRCFECNRSVKQSLNHPGGTCPHCGMPWGVAAPGYKDNETLYMTGNVPVSWRAEALANAREARRRVRREIALHKRQRRHEIFRGILNSITE